MSEIAKRILEQRIIPVATIERVEDAVPVAEALKAGGLASIEITLRTAAAEECIAAIRKAMPDMLVGAGTILSTEQVDRVVERGAMFGVAPGLNPAVVRWAREKDLLFIPGVMTPSEMELALTLGCTLLKFFPAEQAGGAAMLKAMAGPYGHTGVKFLPLGGVNIRNMADYLALPVVGGIGGSWLVDKRLIAAKDWPAITVRTREALAAAKHVAT